MLDGSTKTVGMMQQTKDLRLFQNDLLQAVFCDLKPDANSDARLEVAFVVPRTADAFKSVSQSLSWQSLEAWEKQADYTYTNFFVPKCSIRARLSVKQTLQALGMKEPFTTAADFSALTPKSDLMISDVIHAAFLQLTEAGIEAAAATAVTMMTKSLQIPKNEPVVVRCDKPFYLFIKEKTTGLVLFVGLIASPDKVENSN